MTKTPSRDCELARFNVGLLQRDTESVLAVLDEAVATYIVSGGAPWFQDQHGSYVPLTSTLVGVTGDGLSVCA